MFIQILPDNGNRVILDPLTVVGKVVINDVSYLDTAQTTQFKTHQGVVDTPNFDDDTNIQRMFIFPDIIDRQILPADKHIQPTGPLEQYDIVSGS